jgi:uncharacterized protein YbjT (DUF2867 family)
MLLVTGITGHSGGHFLAELERHRFAESIRCVVRKSSNTEALDRSPLRIEKVVHDFDVGTVDDAIMHGVSEVLHISHLSQTPNLLRAAIRQKVERFISVHTAGIYSRFKVAAGGYRQVEDEVVDVIKGAGIGYVCLRPTMIYGDLEDKNMSVFIRMVDRLRLFPVVDGGTVLLQPVNARDLGKAYYAVLADKTIRNGDYILSGEAPVSMKAILTLISDGLGKRTHFVSVPGPLAALVARLLKLATLGKVDLVEKVLRMTEDRHFPHHDARRDFGYAPMPLSEGLGIEIAQYLARARG